MLLYFNDFLNESWANEFLKDYGTPFDVLGLNKNATEAETKAAYQKLSKELHPDNNPSKEAQEKMKAVNVAYKMFDTKKLKPGEESAAHWKKGKDGYQQSK